MLFQDAAAPDGKVAGVQYDNPLWRYFGYHDDNDRRNPRSLP